MIDDMRQVNDYIGHLNSVIYHPFVTIYYVDIG